MFPRISRPDKTIMLGAPTCIILGLTLGSPSLYGPGLILTGVEILNLLARFNRERLPIDVDVLPELFEADLRRSDVPEEDIKLYLKELES